MKHRNFLLSQKLSLIKGLGNSFRNSFIFLMIICISSSVLAQNTKQVKGVILDSYNTPIIGATIIEKGTSNGTATNVDGQFTLTLSGKSNVVLVSFIGMITQEVNVANKTTVKVRLKDNVTELSETVVIGYGKQKKESVVAAITQTDAKELERAGGVSNIGAALTGNVPGVITSSSTGMPGEEDPKIVIRGQSSWNNSDPLILVDGVERPMNSVDISSVENISVLKDASATAVFGVKGANGVILITTKRGKEGKATIRAAVNTTMKVPSKLPGKYDSYNSLRIRNLAIENELGLSPNGWADYLPEEILEKYRNPANLEEAERYPNIDWVNTLFNDYAMSYNANLNISGGTKDVKYFASADFLSEGDLFKKYDNNRGYESGYGFDRMNVRSNLDFQLTPSTIFRANLSGSYGVKQKPWSLNFENGYWSSAYSVAPDLYMPVYSDGTWGYYYPDAQKGANSVRNLAISGTQQITTATLTTDFTVEQDLSMLVNGLSFKGMLSLDNTFIEHERGINDLYHDAQQKWIDPETGIEYYGIDFDNTTRFDFQEGIDWSTAGGSVQDWSTYRKLYYQGQINYDVTIADKHNWTAMGVFSRDEYATGSEVAYKREDWVFRTTYNFNKKYMIDYNGAYNGSAQFGSDYRFAFFSSGGIGYLISEERFMKNFWFLDMLKFRASYGEIGDDKVSNDRWLYMDQWKYGGTSYMGTTNESPAKSPYTWYQLSQLGNPNVHWETVKKTNLGVDFAFFNGLVAGNFDVFQDNRTDILLEGTSRAVPFYFGFDAPVSNMGEVTSKGYELELRLNHTFSNDLRLWGNFNITHTENEIIYADDPALKPEYQKKEDMAIGQAKTHVGDDYYNTWDELYGSTITNDYDANKLPGNFNIIDYNGDGVINTEDEIPYGYSGWPQNTFNTTVGFEWKGLSAFVQFYGVNNVTRQVVFPSLSSGSHTVYDEGSYWSEDDINADVSLPRWTTNMSGYTRGSRYMYDGSYLRLKNAEISYTFDGSTGWVKKAGLSNVRIFVNGNNLWLWSKMPDDRESNYASTDGWASHGAYPTVKRYNLGINLTF